MTILVPGLDPALSIPAGWHPTPFRQFVLKIHSRCNLRCDYCYVYTMADQTWRDQPRKMSKKIIDLSATRIAEHANAHRLNTVELILHGGEPLLAGVELISYTVRKLRAEIEKYAHAKIHIQTNGLLLNREFLKLFDKLGVAIGVSLDGGPPMNDRHRRQLDGGSSYEKAARAVRTLASPPYRHLFSGILCTIDIRNDPADTYTALLEFQPPLLDFLLPHGNWSAPPAGRAPGSTATPYGDWLATIFDRWYGAPHKETAVRFFEEIMNLLLGGSSRTEEVGLSPVAVAVIETNGDVEQPDHLKAARHGAAALQLNIRDDPFDAALLKPGTVARQLGFGGLAAKCQACSIGRICGGGLYSHRYQNTTGFTNPSVYCRDLYRIIAHIRNRLRHDIGVVRDART